MVLKTIANFGAGILSNPLTVLGLIISGTILFNYERITKPISTGLGVFEAGTGAIFKGWWNIGCAAQCLPSYLPGGQSFEECNTECVAAGPAMPTRPWATDPGGLDPTGTGTGTGTGTDPSDVIADCATKIAQTFDTGIGYNVSFCEAQPNDPCCVPSTDTGTEGLGYDDPFPGSEDITTGLGEVGSVGVADPPLSNIPPEVTSAVITDQQLCSTQCNQKGEGVGFLTQNKAGTSICECEGTVGKEYSYLSDVMGQYAAGGLGSLYRTPTFEED